MCSGTRDIWYGIQCGWTRPRHIPMAVSAVLFVVGATTLLRLSVGRSGLSVAGVFTGWRWVHSLASQLLHASIPRLFLVTGWTSLSLLSFFVLDIWPGTLSPTSTQGRRCTPSCPKAGGAWRPMLLLATTSRTGWAKRCVTCTASRCLAWPPIQVSQSVSNFVISASVARTQLDTHEAIARFE